MKKYVTLFVALCILLPCLSGCYMSKRTISEYEAFDYNVIWEKADKVIRPKKFMGTHEYYSIEGVSKEEFIACKIHHQEIGDYTEEAVVLRHPDKGDAYSLDIFTAQLVMRRRWHREKDTEYWLQLGEKSRTETLLAIEEDIAKEIAADVTAENRRYLTKKQLDAYEQSSPDRLYFNPLNNNNTGGCLWIEFRLTGYENLLWVGQIMKIDNDYVIAIQQSGGGGVYKYLRCDEAFSELLQQVEEEYELIVRS